ncbi:MAG: DNA alkylation repair protein [Candidatus Hodarchaeales archaeon]|jgi:3-methyladenine DNA glycosylase AlkD
METRKKIEKSVEWIRENLIGNKETNPEKISLFNSIIPGCRNPLVVKTPVLEKIARDIWQEKKEDAEFIVELCDKLWQENEYYEENKVAIFLLERFVKKKPDLVLVKIEEYSPHLYTWDLVDQFGMRLCSELVKNKFKNLNKFNPWIRSDEFWIRRLALVSLVRLRNTQLTTDQWEIILPMLETLWEDKEYYVHKAMAWCLRELSKSNSDKVTSFLINRLSQKLTIEHVNKTFVKNCIKKLPSKEQSKILNLI